MSDGDTMRRAAIRCRRAAQRGASSVEYALLAAFIALAILGAVTFFGSSTSDLFQRSCTSVASAAATAC
jgi:Flp pilus assembly pilin Flp